MPTLKNLIKFFDNNLLLVLTICVIVIFFALN